jgi:hypothetical protein
VSGRVTLLTAAPTAATAAAAFVWRLASIAFPSSVPVDACIGVGDKPAGYEPPIWNHAPCALPVLTPAQWPGRVSLDMLDA